MIKKWEYETMDSISVWTMGGGLKNDLKLMGSQGWELVCVKSYLLIFKIYIFKRPINTL